MDSISVSLDQLYKLCVRWTRPEAPSASSLANYSKQRALFAALKSTFLFAAFVYKFYNRYLLTL